MINLLPPELKTDYQYARRNYSLRHWVLLLVIVLVGLGGLTTYGLLTIHQSAHSVSTQVVSAQKQLQAEHLKQTQSQVQDVTNSLRLSVKVLSQEILFSKLIQQIGAAMPQGAVLNGLQINSTTGGINLTAGTTNYTTATQVQVNLSDPSNKIFAKTDIVNIDCNSQGDKSYPCTVTLRALFGNNNPYLFINGGAKS